MTQEHRTLEDTPRGRLKPVPEEIEQQWFEEARATAQAWLSIPPHPLLAGIPEENPQTSHPQTTRTELQGQFPWMSHPWLRVG